MRGVRGVAPRKSRRQHSPREHGSVFKEASAGVTDSSLSCVACGVHGLGQVLPVLRALHPHHVNGNDIRLLPDARANTGNPRKAFSLVLVQWGLLWALAQSRHSPGKSWERDPLGTEAIKGSGARECHSDWALVSPGTVEQESGVQRQPQAVWSRGVPRPPLSKSVCPSPLGLRLQVCVST